MNTNICSFIVAGETTFLCNFVFFRPVVIHNNGARACSLCNSNIAVVLFRGYLRKIQICSFGFTLLTIHTLV